MIRAFREERQTYPTLPGRSAAAMRDPFDSSPEVIRLAVLLKLHRAVALEEWRQICAA
jgi:hypothetical protein